MNSGNSLIFSRQRLKCTDGEKIARMIIKTYPHITFLDLGHNKLADVGIKALCRALINNNTLETLILNDNKISTVGARSLQKALRNNYTLNTLILSNNPLGSGGAAAISIILDNPYCAINHLDLCRCALKDLGTSEIAKGITFNSSIKSLFLTDNDIGKGIKHLAKALEHNNSIKRLDLDMNRLYVGDVIHLAEALNKNRSIIFLNLSRGNMHSSAIYYFAGALHNNCTLRTLDLSYNYIEHGSALLAALKHNFTLTRLDLFANNINSNTRANIDDEIQFNSQMEDMIKILQNMNIAVRNLYVFKHFKIPYHVKLLLCFSEDLCESVNLRLTDFFQKNGYVRLTKALIRKLVKIP